MYIEPYSFEKLLENKKYVSEESYIGFLINVTKSLKAGFITVKQKNRLLDIID